MILDTGPLWAASDKTDAHHAECVRLLARTRGTIYLPTPIVNEVCYGINRRHGPTSEGAFLAGLYLASFKLIAPTHADFARASQILQDYADNNIGYVDAMVIATAERLGIKKVATIDHRHFRTVRPIHIPAFELLP